VWVLPVYNTFVSGVVFVVSIILIFYVLVFDFVC